VQRIHKSNNFSKYNWKHTKKDSNEISKFIHTYPKDSEAIEQLLSNLSNCAHFFKKECVFFNTK